MPKALQQSELKFWGELCSYIDHVKDKLGVPGMAVAVVGGATGARAPFLGEKFAGVRSLAARSLPVDRDTVFQHRVFVEAHHDHDPRGADRAGRWEAQVVR